MKITAKQFALSLYESVEGRLRPRSEASKPAGQVKIIIRKFVELLAKKNKLALAEKIIKEFTEIWQARRGLVAAEIVSAHELSQETVSLLKDYLAQRTGAKAVTLDRRVDKNILGGVIIRYGDKILDGSLKTQLADLKERLIK